MLIYARKIKYIIACYAAIYYLRKYTNIRVMLWICNCEKKI